MYFCIWIGVDIQIYWSISLPAIIPIFYECRCKIKFMVAKKVNLKIKNENEYSVRRIEYTASNLVNIGNVFVPVVQ